MAGKQSGLFFEIIRLAKEIKPKFLFLENVPAITTRGGLQVVNEIASLGYDCRWCVISAASVGALHRRERWFLLAHADDDGTFTGEGRGSLGERIISRERQKEQEEGFWKAERTSGISTDVADTESEGLERFRGSTVRTKEEQSEFAVRSKDDSDTNSVTSEHADKITVSKRGIREAWRDNTGEYRPFKSRDDWQKTIGEVDKCVDGVSAKLDFNTEQLRALGNAVVPQQVRAAWKILFGL